MSKRGKRMIGGFSAGEGAAKAKEFFSSNSIVAKFAFLIFVIMMFILLLRLGTYIIALILEPSPDPILIDGMIDAKNGMIIPQDPSVKGNVPILRSKNDVTGMEFTWSTWIFVEESSFGSNNEKGNFMHIFSKGNGSKGANGVIQPNNAPGVYMSDATNEIMIVMNTFDKPTNTDLDETITIDNIPLNKWINIMVRVSKQRQLDVYINGSLVKRHMYKGVPRQNYGDVLVAQNGGFSGYISELRYFNTGLGTTKIQEIVDKGPNLKMTTESTEQSLVKARPHYLSTRWYFSGVRDIYNP